MRVLVTGGAGYIGSHTCLELAAQGHDVVIADNFSNSSPKVVPRLEKLAGRAFATHKLDVRDRDALDLIFKSEPVDAVIHFAALKAVGESCEKPLEYFDNNVAGTITLLLAMQQAGVHNFIFSSSCTVYGSPERVPVTEDGRLQVTSPYGRTKLLVEYVLEDAASADARLHYASLRYFNPVGAHASGTIGEDPRGVPNNLMPLVCQVASGKRGKLQVYGSDWPTPDGTGMRDYLHVVDLAKAHVAALDFLTREQRSLTVNLGTGRGNTVLEVVRAFEQATGQRVPYELVGRRDGDADPIWADPSLAERELRWRAHHDLESMCRDAWRWHHANPQGYDG